MVKRDKEHLRGLAEAISLVEAFQKRQAKKAQPKNTVSHLVTWDEEEGKSESPLKNSQVSTNSNSTLSQIQLDESLVEKRGEELSLSGFA